MTPEVEKKRRDLFEAKFPPPYYVTWNVDRKAYYSIHRDSTRKRGSENYDAKWQGFNAALDAVEIHTPGKFELPDSPGSMAWNHCIDEYTRNITATGLGLKVKS